MKGTQNHLLDIILENSSEKELEEKMNYICEETAEKLYCLKSKLSKLTKLLENTRINKNFDIQELIEEQIDIFLFEYSKIKCLFKKGREIRYYKECKIKQN